MTASSLAVVNFISEVNVMERDSYCVNIYTAKYNLVTLQKLFAYTAHNIF
jgi:hypothetical protein